MLKHDEEYLMGNYTSVMVIGVATNPMVATRRSRETLGKWMVPKAAKLRG